MKIIAFTGLVASILLTASALADPASPYVGQELREIKSLSPQEIGDYLAGKGMGLAKAAELNGYPGPAHVLELAGPLTLTAEQKTRTQELFKAMEKKAIGLGRQLIDEEQKLDTLFASRTVTPDTLSAALTRIGALQAQLRQAHLEAHLTQTQILTPAQTAKYVELRGYGGHAHDGQSHTH